MRSGRYMKPAGRVTAPTAVVSLVVETRPTSAGTDSRSQVGTFRRAFCCSSRYRRGEWSREEVRTHDSEGAFHTWLEAWSEPRKSTHVFAPVASNALTLTRFWDRITEQGARWAARGSESPTLHHNGEPTGRYQFTRRITNGKPDIITYRVDGKTITWTSGVQYFACGEPSLEQAFDFQPEVPDPPDAVPGLTLRGGRDRARLWLLAVQRLADWWREHHGGPWGLTVGQLAERYFLSRLAPRTICLHSDEDAKRLEAAALWGGRASVWFFGDVTDSGRTAPRPAAPPPASSYPSEEGPIDLYDVRSMYPYLLSAERFPVKLLSHKSTFKVKDLSELVRYCGVIASVRMKSATPEYPHRKGDRVIYPIGDYQTVLAGPELELALAAGDVAEVYSASLYQLGRPFAAMASELLTMRQEAKAGNRPGWELLVKTLSNSFAGKLAARTGRWTPRPDRLTADPWGQWLERGDATGVPSRWRATAGLVELWEDQPERRKSTAACFAYLTAYGRTMMRLIRESLPHRSVVSQDTDGLWVLSSECQSLPPGTLPLGDSPGRMRRAGSARVARWFDAKHYWADGRWTLAGLHQPTRLSVGMDFSDTYTKNPMAGCPAEPPSWVIEVRRVVSLSGLLPAGRIGPSGWLDAPCLSASSASTR